MKKTTFNFIRRILALLLACYLCVIPFPFATAEEEVPATDSEAIIPFFSVAEDNPTLTQDEAQALYQKFYDFYLLINNPNQMTGWKTGEMQDYDSDDCIDRSYDAKIGGKDVHIEHIFHPAKKGFETLEKLISYAETFLTPELAASPLDYCESEGHYLVENGKLYTDRVAWAPLLHNIAKKCALVSVDYPTAILQADLTLIQETETTTSLEIDLLYTENGWRISGGTFMEALYPEWHEKPIPQTADNTALTAWTAAALLSLAVLAGAAGCKHTLSRKHR